MVSGCAKFCQIPELTCRYLAPLSRLTSTSRWLSTLSLVGTPDVTAGVTLYLYDLEDIQEIKELKEPRGTYVLQKCFSSSLALSLPRCVNFHYGLNWFGEIEQSRQILQIGSERSEWSEQHALCERLTFLNSWSPYWCHFFAEKWHSMFETLENSCFMASTSCNSKTSQFLDSSFRVGLES